MLSNGRHEPSHPAGLAACLWVLFTLYSKRIRVSGRLLFLRLAGFYAEHTRERVRTSRRTQLRSRTPLVVVGDVLVFDFEFMSGRSMCACSRVASTPQLLLSVCGLVLSSIANCLSYATKTQTQTHPEVNCVYAVGASVAVA